MFDLAISFVPFFFLIKHKLYFSLLQPFRASRLRTAFISSELRYKGTNNFETMQAFYCFKSPSMKLYELIWTFTKIFALFFGSLTDFYYLCSEKHVQLKHIHYATQSKFNHGAHGTRPTLLSLHPATLSLAQTQIPAEWRTRPWASHQTQASYISSSRSKHYLPTLRAAMSCPFSSISGCWTLYRLNSDFEYLKLRLCRHQSKCLI